MSAQVCPLCEGRMVREGNGGFYCLVCNYETEVINEKEKKERKYASICSSS